MAGSMRGVIMTVGVTGVMAGEGPSDRIGSLSGLSNETSSVASDKTTQNGVKSTSQYALVVSSSFSSQQSKDKLMSSIFMLTSEITSDDA